MSWSMGLVILLPLPHCLLASPFVSMMWSCGATLIAFISIPISLSSFGVVLSHVWSPFHHALFVLTSSFLSLVSTAEFLGVHLDSCLTFNMHTSRTVSACFSMLRQIRSIRRSITRPLLLTLLSSLVITRLDYNISAFSGLSSSQVRRLQSILNASARLLFHVSHTTSSKAWLASN